MMKKPDLTILWLDDRRNPNTYFTNPLSTSASAERNREFYNSHIFNKYKPHFVCVKNRTEFQNYIENHGLPDFVSFDHDVTKDTNFQEYNGRAIARWLVQYCKDTNQPLPKCFVHSANRKRIPEMEDILGIPHIPLPDKPNSHMKNNLPTRNEKEAIEEANAFIFSKSLRTKVYNSNCEIIKANGYETASKKKVLLTDKERLQKETVAYSAPTDVSSFPTVTDKTQTGVFEADCLLVGKALSDKGWNPAILNLADEIWAGGFVHKGSCAQEEELCRRTTLTESLFPIHSKGFGERIGLPVTNIAYPMNKDWGGIYSPNVTVIRDVVSKGYALLDEPYSTSIISVAAVKSPTIDYEKLEIKMSKAIEREKNKMRTILRIGLLHGHDSLVLGAFGCGAFHTPPSHVARLFAEIFEEPEFKNKYKGLFFAVLEGRKQEHNPEGNVKPFVDVFGEMTIDNAPSLSRKKPVTKKSQEDNQENHTLIENIKTLMTARGYTQSSLARVLGKQSVVINRALRGKAPISPKMQMELAEHFGVTIEELNGSLTIPAAKNIQGFIKFNNKIRDISTLKDLKAVYEEIVYQIEQRPKEVERMIAECKANEERVKTIPHIWNDIDLFRHEEYNPKDVYCWTFRKANDERDNIVNSLGNMCAGYPFAINGHTFFGSEQAYIAGLFSNNTDDCISIQKELIKEENGYASKKTIRNRNERKFSRRDWEEFNVQWMLYVVWQKCKQNKAFASLLKKIPRNAIIIENSAMQTGETADFWGCKNDEWKSAFRLIADNAEIVCSGKAASAIQDKVIKDSNAITCIGTYKGVNCMGKILTICRDCLLAKTEPPIDYELLKSKQIYLLGELIKFDKK